MSGSSHPILIVEDSEDDLYMLQRSLRIAEIANASRHVEDGQQAIDYLQGVGPYCDRAAYPLPALILLDLKLPLKNGFEVLAWIRQQPVLKTIVVIILTSSGENQDVTQAYELGANAFLVKPTSVDKLTEIVKSLEIFWLRHNKFKVWPPARGGAPKTSGEIERKVIG